MLWVSMRQFFEYLKYIIKPVAILGSKSLLNRIYNICVLRRQRNIARFHKKIIVQLDYCIEVFLFDKTNSVLFPGNTEKAKRKGKGRTIC